MGGLHVMVSQRKNESREDYLIRRRAYHKMRRKGLETNRGKKDPNKFWPNGRPRRKFPWCKTCKETIPKKDWAKKTTLGRPMKQATCGQCRSKLTWRIKKGG